MGAYLSEPVRDKVSEDKCNDQLSYGVSSMQGWRISQEDAHNCCVDFDEKKSYALFAVYDGHGGAEVATYTSMHFPDFLKSLPAYKEKNFSQALEDAFLGFDAKLKEESVLQELKHIAGVEESVVDEEEEQNEVADLCKEADMPIEQLMERYGGKEKNDVSRLKALRKENNFQSPVIRAKTETSGLNEEEDGALSEQDPVKIKLDDKLVNGHSENENNENLEKENREKSLKEKINDTKNEIKLTKDETKTETALDNSQSDQINGGHISNEKIDSKTKDESPHTTDAESKLGKCSDAKDAKSNGMNDSSSGGSSAAGVSSSTGGSDSSGSSSTGQASPSKDAGVGGSSSEAHVQPSSSSGRTRKPRKNVIPEEGEDESSFSESEGDSEDEEEWDSEDVCEPDSEDDEEDELDGSGTNEDEDEDEMFMCGGEEPGIDSGCTAVVALIHGKELYVANAGDSRCVVCRDGKALDMSEDHKPEDRLERERIEKAGGRVTQDGRVNGGLNLSRALGDHCYKTNEELPAKEQMITALPDIRSVTLTEKDDFMVLACDGIWNSMSSQDVVNFVKERLDAGVTKLSSVAEEMFEFCLAPDTTGNGTGCDNMTCIIVTLNKLVGTVSGTKRKVSTEINADDVSAEAKKAKEESD